MRYKVFGKGTGLRLSMNAWTNSFTGVNQARCYRARSQSVLIRLTSIASTIFNSASEHFRPNE